MNSYSAVIDTNVLVSALLTNNKESATYLVLQYLYNKRITPIYSYEILKEYNEVLLRKEFNFPLNIINKVIRSIKDNGICLLPLESNENFIDKTDRIFYETCLAYIDEGCYLITGNLRHYPAKSYIINPRQFINIITKN